MKAYEVKKGQAEIPHGRVMMAVEGIASHVEAIASMMAVDGYQSTQCSDMGDNEGEVVEYFMIARTDKVDFMNTYKTHKKTITTA
jgi:hypothetical protein